MRQPDELNRDLNAILNAVLSLVYWILISLTTFHPAKMEFASQIHTLNTVLASNWYKSFCLNDTKWEDDGYDIAVLHQGSTAACRKDSNMFVNWGDAPYTSNVSCNSTNAWQNDSHRVQDATMAGAALFHNNISVILRFWMTQEKQLKWFPMLPQHCMLQRLHGQPPKNTSVFERGHAGVRNLKSHSGSIFWMNGKSSVWGGEDDVFPHQM